MCCSPASSTKCLSRQIVRFGFGLALLFAGIAHYRTATGFAMSVGDGLGPQWLVSLGTFWGYILPALMIVGGLSMALKVMPKIGVMAAGLALASIPAGLMLKSAITGVSMGDTMPAAMNAYIWILVYLYAAKASKKCCGPCGGACATDGTCSMCGMTPCMCGASKKEAAPAPKKSAVKKPAAKKAKKM